MNKKLIISLSIIGLVAVAAIGATIAYYNDTETSTGNIFTAGSIDLKVDHTRETYNDIDCKTCSVEIKSNTLNMVVAKSGGGEPTVFPFNALLVNPINSAWTASISGASWIWATNPTTEYDARNDVIYTFRKTFEWWGPIVGTTLNLGVGSDNSYEVWLNGTKIGSDVNEKNFTTTTQDTYSGAQISPYIWQGVNTLEIKVKNWKQTNGTWQTNPGGLLYKLVIDGQCGSDYFKTNCRLWGSKDLGAGDYFWNFNDVKPGDRGTNVISIKVNGNDAYVCMLTNHEQNNENVLTNSEGKAGDTTDGTNAGELSQYLNLVVWEDSSGDGIHQLAETILYNGGFDGLNTGIAKLSIAGNGSDNLGIAWCLGSQTVDSGTGAISCSGSGNQDMAQTDKLLADLVLYATQQRNNENFNCASVTLLP